jgi:fructosamine-3-kinase
MPHQSIPDDIQAHRISGRFMKIEECNGGDVSSSYVVTTPSTTLFLKVNSAAFEHCFRSEGTDPTGVQRFGSEKVGFLNKNQINI